MGEIRFAVGVVAACVAAILAFAGPSVAAPAPDCDGPAGDAQPGTLAWQQREQENDYCGEQRFYDTSSNPAFVAASAGALSDEDPFRDPAALNRRRFRWRTASFPDRAGQQLAGMLFEPLSARKPPYPGVVVVHGGGATQEMYLWAAEGLAEAGYMVLTFQIPEPDNAQAEMHYPDARDALDWFESSANPWSRQLDHAHVGLAGHSAGGVAVSRLGQEDPRVGAIVSWDRAQSSPMPPDLKLRTPALFVVADFNCQKVPVCVPQPYLTPPDPLGPGNKDEDFQRLSAAGVDTMKIALRAATHLDFTQFAPGTGSRYGAVVTLYYTLAWFDRYLKAGAGRGALARLTATRFDDSADIHNISGGTFDPATGANVPAHIAGQPVVDRLSFHFRSAYWLDGGRHRCVDMRAGC